jgi:hypothetical protein
MAAHGDAALIGLDEAVEHFPQGALAGTVGADQAQAFAAPELEGDIVDGPEFVLAQLVVAALPAEQLARDILHAVPQRAFQRAAEFLRYPPRPGPGLRRSWNG